MDELRDRATYLLSTAEQQRQHWSGMINTLMGFVIVANVGIWTYSLSNFLRTLELPNLPLPFYIISGAAISSLSLFAWRWYTHVLDDQVTNLYPEIIYYETVLGINHDYGVSGYLIRSIPQLKDMLSRKLCPEQRSALIRILVNKKRIGGRGHNIIDWITVAVIIAILLGCVVAEILVGDLCSYVAQIRQGIWGSYIALHIIGIVLILGSFVAMTILAKISNRNPTSSDMPSEEDLKKSWPSEAAV